MKQTATERHQLIQYMAIFIGLSTVLLWSLHTTLYTYPLLHGAGLLWFGWWCWTFAEYIAHRFFMHPHHAKNKHGKGRHHDHHLHPTAIKVTSRQRLLFAGILMILIGLNIILPRYFIIFTGLFSGFVWYCYMHVILHQPWTARLFPRLQQYHVYHHCKYPDKCFGVSVTWWDRICNTTPPKEAVISDRIRHFYFSGSSH